MFSHVAVTLSDPLVVASGWVVGIWFWSKAKGWKGWVGPSLDAEFSLPRQLTQPTVGSQAKVEFVAMQNFFSTNI